MVHAREVPKGHLCPGVTHKLAALCFLSPKDLLPWGGRRRGLRLEFGVVMLPRLSPLGAPRLIPGMSLIHGPLGHVVLVSSTDWGLLRSCLPRICIPEIEGDGG